MSKNSIKFIGTGSGKTSLKRFHSSFLISTENYKLLIDCGDGISKAILSQNLSYHSINGILITHLHPDHYSGLAALIIQMKLNGRKNILRIFVHQNLAKTIENFIYQSYIFQEKMDFEIKIEKLKDNELLKIDDNVSLLPRQNAHLDEYVKYAKKGKLSFSCSSVLFKINDKNIFYTGDIGSGKDLNLFEEFNIDFMISEITHVKIDEILLFFDKEKAEELFFTHISDEDEKRIFDLKISDEQKDSVIVAFDGLEFRF